MIIITSEVTIDKTKWEEELALAKSHGEQFRLKEGCNSHRSLIPPEKENCMFFYEEWVDREAIDFNFAEGYSRHLSKSFQTWATSGVKVNFHTVA